MKLLRITAAIAILSARADAQCEFCSNGISNPDFAIPDSGGQTCGSIAEFATALEGDICDSIKTAELLCCADSVAGAVDPCPFCPNGATPADSSFAMLDEADGVNCDFFVDYAKTLERETEDCANTLGMEFVCCPPEVTNPCSVCPNGATVGDDFVLDGDSGDSVTCGQTIEYAKIIETETDMCVGLQGVEMVCCPSPAENPCSICPDGATVGDDFVLEVDGEDSVTCGQMIEYAKMTETETDICAGLQGAEMQCCPSPVDEASEPAANVTSTPDEKEDELSPEEEIIDEASEPAANVTSTPDEKGDEPSPKEETVDEASEPAANVTSTPEGKEDESSPKEEQVDEDMATNSAGFVGVMLTAFVSTVNAIAFM